MQAAGLLSRCRRMMFFSAVSAFLLIGKAESISPFISPNRKFVLPLQRFLGRIGGWFCACGGIGRRARLRIWCLATCRFESYQAHGIKC